MGIILGCFEMLLPFGFPLLGTSPRWLDCLPPQSWRNLLLFFLFRSSQAKFDGTCYYSVVQSQCVEIIESFHISYTVFPLSTSEYIV